MYRLTQSRGLGDGGASLDMSASGDGVSVVSTPVDLGPSLIGTSCGPGCVYGDSSAMVDTSTGLPLYVASPSNPNPTAPPKPPATGISPTLIAVGVGVALLLVMIGGRR